MTSRNYFASDGQLGQSVFTDYLLLKRIIENSSDNVRVLLLDFG